jgi:putative transcriptional regulator
MKNELFAELMESAEEALSHAKGKRELRTTVLPVPPAPMRAVEVKQLRASVRASQAVFAHYLNVSTKLVQAWESQRRRPEGAALKLLRVAQSNPSLVFTESGTVKDRPSTRSKTVDVAAKRRGEGSAAGSRKGRGRASASPTGSRKAPSDGGSRVKSVRSTSRLVRA